MKMKNRVLAVLALALLITNMAPVSMAEAAVRSDFENMLTEQLRYYRNEDKPMYAYLGYEFWEDGAESPYKTLLLIEGYSSTVFFRTQSGSFDMLFGYFPCTAISENGSVRSVNGDISICDYAGGRTYKMYYLEGNIDFSTYDFPDWVTFDVPEPDPLVLPVTEAGYEYWLYHKTTSGEYMYWSKEPFDLEVSEGKYILNLSTGDIVYRLHLSLSHTYYRQVLSGSMQYVISSGDIFRSGQELVFDDVTIDAWTEGDVTSEEVQAPQYSIPHITKFLKRIRSARSYADMPREYSMSIDIALSGDFDAAVTEQKVLIDGNYILPSEDYFYLCDTENIEPSTTHFMEFVKGKQDRYYIYVDWSHIESIVNLAGLTSDYGFRLTYSNAIDALIERGEFDVLYSKSIQAAYDDDIRRLCCPYRLACTLIGVVGEEYYYGDTYITVLYSELDKAIEDVSGVYSDYVSLDNDQRTDAIESTINGAQDDKLQDYIDKKDAELDALIEEYEMKLATLEGSLASGGSGDLFGTFSRIANGVSGMSGSFRNIATAVGNVFAFFPDEITTLLYAGFIALIVIAVYKALRG